MKKTLIEKIPYPLPRELMSFTEGACIFDSSSSPEARVYYVAKDGGYYLKRSSPGSLRDEAKMNDYFHKKGMGAQVLHYTETDCDWLLTRAVVGEDCTHEKYISDPRRLAALMGELLRALHDTDCSDCPVRDRITGYISLAEENYALGRFDTSHFPDSFGYKSATDAHDALCAGKSLLKNEVLIHGDFCLPNICLLDWRLSGYIDVGFGGIGDRHIDLFWGSWTLGFNLGTNAYSDIFFDAYGREKIDFDIIRTVAAAEVFR